MSAIVSRIAQNAGDRLEDRAERQRTSRRSRRAKGSLLMSDPKPYVVAGKFKTSDETFEVKSPFDGRTVATVTKPTKDDIEAATAAAHEVSHETRKLPVYARAEALAHISKRLAERGEEVAELIAKEGGKPLKWARAEAARAVSTFRWAAEEARRFSGELQRLDTDPAAVGRLAVVNRYPRGAVLGISPFNFPLKLVAP